MQSCVDDTNLCCKHLQISQNGIVSAQNINAVLECINASAMQQTGCVPRLLMISRDENLL